MWEILGVLGGVFLVAAYALLSFEFVTNKHVIYHLFNILGSAGLVASNFMLGAWPGGVVNLVFGGLGLVGLYQSFFRKNKSTKDLH